MGRGRRPNMALEPTRALQTQRAFRQRKADHLAGLEESIDQLTKENNRFRQLLRLEPRPEPEKQSRERSTSSRLPSEPAAGSNGEEELTVQETKQQLAVAAAHVEEQMTQLYHTLKVLRSLIESNPASTEALHSAAKASGLGVIDDHRAAKRGRTAYEFGEEDGAMYTSSPAGNERGSSTINGVNMTSGFHSPTPPSNGGERDSRHLPPPHAYSQTGASNGSNRPPLNQAASAPVTSRTAPWNSPSGSVASPAMDAQIGRHHHAGQQSASRSTHSPMNLPSYASPKPHAHPPQHYAASMKTEPYFSHMQQPQHLQQQPFHYASNSIPYAASNGEAGSYSATRSLALQALNSPHGRQGYAMNECDAGPPPSTPSAATTSTNSASSASHQSDNTSSATPTSDHLASGADGKGAKKACCPPKTTTHATDINPPPPLGISVDMKTHTPNGEPCCFGLVECDDQGRIII